MAGQTETEAIVKLAQDGSARTELSRDGREFLITKSDEDVLEITDPDNLKLQRPRYISQNVTLQTRDSLADYINRFKVSATVLFADQEKSTIVGLLDYHEASTAALPQSGDEVVSSPDTAGKADHAVHRASMVLPFSEEWKVWTAIDGQLMSQLEFARFIEENSPDLAAPAAADLIECIRDIQSVRKANFTAQVNTASDNVDFEYTDSTETGTRGASLTIPKEFVLRIPVYFGEAATELHAFLRYRNDEGKLFLGIKISRREYVRQACFRAIVTDVFERTGCPVVYGRAERRSDGYT